MLGNFTFSLPGPGKLPVDCECEHLKTSISTFFPFSFPLPGYCEPALTITALAETFQISSDQKYQKTTATAIFITHIQAQQTTYELEDKQVHFSAKFLPDYQTEGRVHHHESRYCVYFVPHLDTHEPCQTQHNAN